MGSARLHGTRRLKNRRIIQSLFERPGGDNGVRVIRKGLVAARYRILSPGRTARESGRSAFSRLDGITLVPAGRLMEGHRFQFGVAVGRRTGNAVSRNAVKRILRERVRLRQAEIDRAVADHAGGTGGTDGGDAPHPVLVMMLVSSGTADDAGQVHLDADGVISALIEKLST